MYAKFLEQCLAHVSTVELLAIIWPWGEYTWEEAAMTWGPQGGEICGRHGQLSRETQEFCFQKIHFKHLWWISMLGQREDSYTQKGFP